MNGISFRVHNFKTNIMNAKDVYNVANALSSEEFRKLYFLIHDDFKKKEITLKSHKSHPNFDKYDALKYLIENVFKKPIKK